MSEREAISSTVVRVQCQIVTVSAITLQKCKYGACETSHFLLSSVKQECLTESETRSAVDSILVWEGL